jgi:uncharacterized protein YkwD
MAQEDQLGDPGSDGHIVDCHDLVYRVGVVGYRWSALGEMVGTTLGISGAAQFLMSLWWNSPPHQAIILNGVYAEIGVGLATSASGQTYGDVVFAAPA